MKTQAFFAAAVFLGFSLGAAENMLKNGDFESSSIKPWMTTKKGLKTIYEIKNGKLICSGDTRNKYNYNLTLIQDVTQKLVPGKRYLLSAEALGSVKNAAKKQGSIQIRAIDENGKSIKYYGVNLTLDNSLRKYNYIYTPPANAVSHQIYISHGNFENDDFIEVDNVSLTDAPEIAQEEGNMIVNGNFEYFELEPWGAPQTGKNNKFYQLSTDTSFGKQCLAVSGDLKHRYKNSSFIQNLPALQHGKEYLLSGRVRACNKNATSGGLTNLTNKSFKIHVREINSANRSLRYIGFAVNLSEDTWKYYEKMFVPHKEAVKWELYISADQLETADAVFVDELKLSPAGDAGSPFNHSATETVAVSTVAKDGFVADINKKSGLLHKLVINGVEIQPAAKLGTVVAVERNGAETLLDGKNTPAEGFKAEAKYDFADGMFREVVTVEALQDFNDTVKIGVRHGINTAKWDTQLGALRPMRVLPADKSTIFSFGTDFNDLNPGILDSYQHTAYPLVILENKDYYLLAGSRNIDDFVTIATNKPAGYIPAMQRNPKSIKKGDKFRFENNWKLFSRKKYMLRDLWRFYQEHLQTKDKDLANFIPAKYPEDRHFYPGVFAAHTYLLKSREDRTPDGANIWFYSCHDNIRERYPISGSWWSSGNAYKEKIEANMLKKYMARVQKERDFKLILYLRQLANLRERDRGAFPDSWYKRVPGGALHLYGGGYQVKLPKHVAEDVGYDTIPWGQHNFANPDFRKFYLNEIYTFIDFYQPRAIGWDMGSDLDEFKVIATTYRHLRDQGHKIKAVANEGAGPTAAYVDMVLLENGILGGKSPYDFEVNRAYTRTLVCLERWNIFRLAFDVYTTGKKSWLNENGIKENNRYLEVLLKERPELKNNRIEAARLCQLRVSLYDLALGASPGYMEEAAPVPPTLVKVAGEVNGLYPVNRSFAVTFPNNSNVDRYKMVSAWQNDKSFRLVAFNNRYKTETIDIKLDHAYFASIGWKYDDLKNFTAKAVSPDGEKDIDVKLINDVHFGISIHCTLPAFTALMFSADKK